MLNPTRDKKKNSGKETECYLFLVFLIKNTIDNNINIEY